MTQGVVAEIPGANIKESLVTILSEANSRMVQNSFQRAKGDLGNSLSNDGIYVPIVAEIGAEMGFFWTQRHLASWGGSIPWKQRNRGQA